MGLDVQLNIASYPLLTRILAHFTNLAPGRFIQELGDAHAYLKQHLERSPRPLPALTIQAPRETAPDALLLDDFVMDGYDPHPLIKLHMTV